MKSIIFITSAILIFGLLSFQVFGEQDYIASCQFEGDTRPGVEIKGATYLGNNMVQCDIECGFSPRPVPSTGEHNVEEPVTPRNNHFSVVVEVGSGVRITDPMIRDNCCAVRSDVCFWMGECYVAKDPSGCSAGWTGVAANFECIVYIDGVRHSFTNSEDCPGEPPGSDLCPPDKYRRIEGNIIYCENPINGVCGFEDEKVYSYDKTEFDSSSFCIAGTFDAPSFPEPGETVTWSCYGVFSGSAQTCSVRREDIPLEPIDGVCGAAATNFLSSHTEYSDISTEFCESGTLREGTPNFPEHDGSVEWFCDGINDGESVSCVATRDAMPVLSEPIDGKCGLAARVYEYSELRYEGGFCEYVQIPEPFFPSPGSKITWSCPPPGPDGGSSVQCEASRTVEPLVLRCRCNPVGRTFNNIRCQVFDPSTGANIGSPHDFVPHGGDYPYFERNVVEQGIEVQCSLPIFSECDTTGVSPGICPTNCKSWQHPACDYGRYGIQVVNTLRKLANLIPGVNIPDIQQKWNEWLTSEDTVIGKVYSALDSVPGTPEWLTARICESGLDLSDEDVCGPLGLPPEDCSLEWGGYTNFIGNDITISISAEYASFTNKSSRYRISWRMFNLDDTERYRVFLANFRTSPPPSPLEFSDEIEYYDEITEWDVSDYNLIPQNKKIIFPQESGFVEISSENIEYISSFRYSDVCIEFADASNSLLEALGISFKNSFICRKINYYS